MCVPRAVAALVKIQERERDAVWFTTAARAETRPNDRAERKKKRLAERCIYLNIWERARARTPVGYYYFGEVLKAAWRVMRRLRLLIGFVCQFGLCERQLCMGSIGCKVGVIRCHLGDI